MKRVNPDTITLAEATRLLGMGKAPVTRFRHEGLLIRLPGYPSYSRSDVQAFIDTPWINGRQASELLGISRSRVSELATEGKIPVHHTTSGQRVYPGGEGANGKNFLDTVDIKLKVNEGQELLDSPLNPSATSAQQARIAAAFAEWAKIDFAVSPSIRMDTGRLRRWTYAETSIGEHCRSGLPQSRRCSLSAGHCSCTGGPTWRSGKKPREVSTQSMSIGGIRLLVSR